LSNDVEHAVGVSLWLSPAGEEARDLGRLIDELSVRLGTPRFDPHLTLLGGLGHPQSEAEARAGGLAACLPPLRLAFGAIEGEPVFLRCLYAAVEPSAELNAARAEALAVFGPPPAPAPRPHVSLVYGRLSPDARAELARALRPRLPPQVIARHLDLMCTEGPPAEWRRIRRFGLGPGAGIISG
jgi:2'-5' RNA ligase superfamily protein